MKVYHPDVEGLSQDVAKDSVDEWLDQGWLKSQPKSKVPDEAPATS